MHCFAGYVGKIFEKEEHEEVKEWVLAISVEQSLERTLPLDSRGNFEGSLVDSKGVTHKPCIITGLFSLSLIHLKYLLILSL